VATRKQRRRREKERRHEYEIVYVDPDGQEVAVEEPERKPGPAKSDERTSKPGAKNAGRAERTVEPPTWNRTFRRAAIFAPIMLVFLYFARPKSVSTAAVALQALLLIAILILFMYATDSFLYRSYQKRLAKRGGSATKPK
jgi:hypothetical protein